MEPAVCAVCGSTPQYKGDGNWVEFADYETEEGLAITHPQGLKYFCGRHLKQAEALQSLSLEQALLTLRDQYSLESPEQPSKPQSWWKRLWSR